MSTKPQTAIPPGSVSYLPAYCGDGYNYGGGIIVSFGKVSLSLGDLNPASGYEESCVALAHLIAAAPGLLSAAEIALVELDAVEREIGVPSKAVPMLRTALAKARGEA